MALIYLDSSALFKRYRPEIGTDALDGLFDEQQDDEIILTSALTSVEVSATARRLLKGRLIRQSQYVRILFRFTDDSERRLSLEPITEAIVQRARIVAQTYALRAGDALQLATALEVWTLHPPESLTFFTADRELADAAIAAGLTTINPEDPNALARLRSQRRA